MAFEKVFDAQNGTIFKFDKQGDVLEGHYMGSFDFEGDYGPTKKHVFSTETGATIVIGQRHLIQTLPTIKPGTMVRVTYLNDLPPKKKGQRPMKLFGFEQDKKNVIDTFSQAAAEATVSQEPEETYASATDAEDYDEPGLEDDDTALDETPPARAQAPKQTAQPPSAAAQQKVKDLLAKRKTA